MEFFLSVTVVALAVMLFFRYDVLDIGHARAQYQSVADEARVLMPRRNQ